MIQEIKEAINKVIDRIAIWSLETDLYKLNPDWQEDVKVLEIKGKRYYEVLRCIYSYGITFENIEEDLTNLARGRELLKYEQDDTTYLSRTKIREINNTKKHERN